MGEINSVTSLLCNWKNFWGHSQTWKKGVSGCQNISKLVLFKGPEIFLRNPKESYFIWFISRVTHAQFEKLSFVNNFDKSGHSSESSEQKKWWRSQGCLIYRKDISIIEDGDKIQTFCLLSAHVFPLIRIVNKSAIWNIYWYWYRHSTRKFEKYWYIYKEYKNIDINIDKETFEKKCYRL